MDRPWTPGDVVQAEDRIRRIGQKHSEVASYWITAFDFDGKLDKVLECKDGRAHTVLTSG
jgi:SNF2 family DNA or RNA helicase